MKALSLLVMTIFFFQVAQAKVSDPLFSQQWHLQNDGQLILRSSGELTRDRLKGIKGADIRWIKPSEVTAKLADPNREVIVAVLDTGIDILHPDLQGRIWYDKARCQNGQAHDAENACHGFNFIEMTSNIADDVGHGTHVSGLIAANLNDLGVTGVTAKNIKIMPVKVVNNQTRDFVQNGRMITDIFADGIRYAVQNGASVINISLGWPKLVETPKIRIAIDKAIESGVVIVAAAGNNGKNIPTYPCAYKGVICVGAMDNQGSIAEYSNYGGKVDLLAPGENIISTYPANLESRSLGIQGYEVKQGSSQAAPLVAAVAATLKLLEPEMSLSEIKARLFKSATLNESYKNRDEKRVLFGALDMKRALEEKIELFVAPSFKDLLTVHVDKNSHFTAKLPIVNFLGEVEDLEVNLSLSTDAAKILSSTFKIEKLEAAAEKTLELEGEILDMAADSLAELMVEIKYKGEVISQTQTMISFARNLEEIERESFNLAGVDHRLVSFFSSDRKSSRLQRVLDRFKLLSAPEFSYVDPRKITAEKYVVSLLQLKEDRYVSLDLELPALSQVLKVFAMDYNADGRSDYMVYAIDSEKKNLVLSFYNQDGSLLYGESSHWYWPISTFEGLPQEGDREDFDYFKVDLPGYGKVLTPAMNKTWELPEEDNTRHILDRLSDKGVEHIYYLKPSVKNDRVTLTVRALSGWNFVKMLQDRFSLFADEVINLAKPLKQNLKEATDGTLTVPLAVGSEAKKQNYLAVFKGSDIALRPISGPALVIEDNNRIPIENLVMPQKHEHLLFALSGRTTGRITRINEKSQLSESYVMKRESWGDPFFSIIGSFKTESHYWYFMESRYKIIASNESGESFELPLNRDSSFPGVQFSETLRTTVVDSSEGALPAVMIDSTLVFGDRIYTMVARENEFVRPIKLSVETSPECIPLGHGSVKSEGEKSKMMFLCRDRFLNMRIEMVPLSY